jgi:hypothetical protein
MSVHEGGFEDVPIGTDVLSDASFVGDVNQLLSRRVTRRLLAQSAIIEGISPGSPLLVKTEIILLPRVLESRDSYGR